MNISELCFFLMFRHQNFMQTKRENRKWSCLFLSIIIGRLHIHEATCRKFDRSRTLLMEWRRLWLRRRSCRPVIFVFIGSLDWTCKIYSDRRAATCFCWWNSPAQVDIWTGTAPFAPLPLSGQPSVKWKPTQARHLCSDWTRAPHKHSRSSTDYCKKEKELQVETVNDKN